MGSTHYINSLSDEELGRIAMYMNFDMVGSPNYIFMTQDADESSFTAPVAVPDGSVAIEDLFESFYTKQDEPYDDAAFDGRSDYQAFINNDIPAGGLFTGAEVPKTAEQKAIWGGTVGAQFDPCYRQACDTFANNNNHHALEVNADSIGVRGADVRVLDRVRQRGAGQEGPRNLRAAGSSRSRAHFRALTRPRISRGGGRTGRPLGLPRLSARRAWRFAWRNGARISRQRWRVPPTRHRQARATRQEPRRPQ